MIKEFSNTDKILMSSNEQIKDINLIVDIEPDEAQKLIEILQQKSDAAKGALKIMRHILLAMELI